MTDSPASALASPRPGGVGRRVLFKVCVAAAVLAGAIGGPAASAHVPGAHKQASVSGVAVVAEPASTPAPSRASVNPSPEGGAVTVTIPDLSYALTDTTAPRYVRVAACHQATRLDDETDPLLAACLTSLH